MQILKTIIIIAWLILATFLVSLDLWNKRSVFKLPSAMVMAKSLWANEIIYPNNNCTSIKSTHVISGPYAFLPPGLYQLSFQLKGRGKVNLEVVTNPGGNYLIVSEREINSENHREEKLEFSTSGGWSHEFRVYYLDGEEVCAKNTTLVAKNRYWYNIIKKIPKTILNLYKKTT